jgi:hypothetical protein
MSHLDDVIIAPELARRPARSPNYAAENRALLALARPMADAPETILQRSYPLPLTGCMSHVLRCGFVFVPG